MGCVSVVVGTEGSVTVVDEEEVATVGLFSVDFIGLGSGDAAIAVVVVGGAVDTVFDSFLFVIISVLSSSSSSIGSKYFDINSGPSEDDICDVASSNTTISIK